jgi:hypothetical protein
VEDIDAQFPASQDLRLPHIGLVARAIEEFRAFYVDVLQYRERTSVIRCPEKTASAQFFRFRIPITISNSLRQIMSPASCEKRLARESG